MFFPLWGKNYGAQTLRHLVSGVIDKIEAGSHQKPLVDRIRAFVFYVHRRQKNLSMIMLTLYRMEQDCWTAIGITGSPTQEESTVCDIYPCITLISLEI